MPAVIFEMGFISNQEEEKLLLSKEFQEKMTEGICQGLIALLPHPRRAMKEDAEEMNGS